MDIKKSFFKLKQKPEITSILIFTVLLVINIILQPSFFTVNSLKSNFLSFTPYILLAMAQAVVILAGGLDLSIGGSVSLINVILATRMTDSPESIVVALILGFLAAITMGFINGYLVGYIKIPALIATFATSSLWGGIALFILPTPGGYVHSGFANHISQFIGFIPIVLLYIIAGALIWVFIQKRKYGRYLYAVGSDENSAYSNGINIEKTRMLAYVLSSIFTFLAVIVITAQTSSGDSSMGASYTLISVAAVVVGGISLSGGKGNILGAVFGALSLSIIINLIYFAGIPSVYQEFINGVIIIAALITGILSRRKEKKVVHNV